MLSYIHQTDQHFDDSARVAFHFSIFSHEVVVAAVEDNVVWCLPCCPKKHGSQILEFGPRFPVHLKAVPVTADFTPGLLKTSAVGRREDKHFSHVEESE